VLSYRVRVGKAHYIHRRNEEELRHLVFLDKRAVGLGVEMVDSDIGAVERQGLHKHAQAAGMEKRTVGKNADALGLIVLMLGGHLHGVGHDHAVRPDDALGQAGRAAGVKDGGEVRLFYFDVRLRVI